jgi:hypothetical protein
MPSNGRRFLDNIDMYMGKQPGAPGVEPGSAPSTPGRIGRGRGIADRRSASEAIVGGRKAQGPLDPRSPFKTNMYFFENGMGAAEHLGNTRQEERAAYGLSDLGTQKLPGGGGRRGGGGMMRKMVGADVNGTSTPMNLQMNGVAVPYTNNQIYGNRAAEGEPPSSAADKGRKARTNSNVIMGM